MARTTPNRLMTVFHMAKQTALPSTAKNRMQNSILGCASGANGMASSPRAASSGTAVTTPYSITRRAKRMPSIWPGSRLMRTE